MYMNKKAVVVSKTEPVGLVVKFTSENERGLTALFGDMNGMGVQVITVGPVIDHMPM